jgi:hypothetical protein
MHLARSGHVSNRKKDADSDSACLPVLLVLVLVPLPAQCLYLLVSSSILRLSLKEGKRISKGMVSSPMGFVYVSDRSTGTPRLLASH